MFLDGDEKSFPQWKELGRGLRPKAKTSHSLSQVPFYVFEAQKKQRKLLAFGEGRLSQVASTLLELMELKGQAHFDPSLFSS